MGGLTNMQLQLILKFGGYSCKGTVLCLYLDLSPT